MIEQKLNAEDLKRFRRELILQERSTATVENISGIPVSSRHSSEGARFELYRAAELGSDGQWSLTGVFTDYPVEITGSDWLDMAATLSCRLRCLNLTRTCFFKYKCTAQRSILSAPSIF